MNIGTLHMGIKQPAIALMKMVDTGGQEMTLSSDPLSSVAFRLDLPRRRADGSR